MADLSKLADRVGGSLVGSDVTITDVFHDHRDCRAGGLFVARRGHRVDGHQFVSQAVACSAVCVDHHVADTELPQLIVADTAAALGQLAAAVHGDPFTRLRAVGVTGTNGKTMVTRLLGDIAAAADMTPAVVGTLGWRLGSDETALERTSPEASDLHRIAAEIADAGCDVAAFEVSSHALVLGRVGGAHFEVAAFTNLSQDHLDFHGDMDRYLAAKARLFSSDLSSQGVVWTDDPAGRRVAAAASIPITTVGTDADVGLTDLEAGLDCTRFRLRTATGTTDVRLPLIGGFNAANAAVAAAVALVLEVPLDAVVAGLENARPVAGRYERVLGPWPFAVIVDYAHTPDGIATAIAAGRELSSGRVIVVVGAGGDRDVDKRRPMGVAAGTADLVIVTTDNPRSEDPAAIATELGAGVAGIAEAITILDRREAMAAALKRAEPGDLVLVLGKGHETVQEFADRTEPFNDVAVLQELAT